MWRKRRSTILLGLALLGWPSSRTAAETAAPASAVSPYLTHGVAIGEVTTDSVVLWGRCDRAGRLHGALADLGVGHRQAAEVATAADWDFTGRLRFSGLRPDTRYRVDIWCSADGGESKRWQGNLRTPPAEHQSRPLRLVWGGDIGGQNVCRDRERGYSVFDRVRESKPDFFVALGDMIYADDHCREVGRYGNPQRRGPPPAGDLDGFRAHWRYNRDDPALQRLLEAVPVYSVWDDHETKDDAGPGQDEAGAAPGVHLLPPARQAFLEYQPIDSGPSASARMYRAIRWGKHLEMFLLDTRSYRDANRRADTGEPPKSMLGAEQREWLLASLRKSDATWKLIVSSVPLSIPTGDVTRGRDGWANFDTDGGFESEMMQIVEAMREMKPRNAVWITTDVHFATGFRYRPIADDPSFTFYEFTSGPLNAGVFPRTEFDPTLGGERLFLHGPPADKPIEGIEAAQHWFNFGEIDVDRNGGLRVSIVDGDGKQVFGKALKPE